MKRLFVDINRCLACRSCEIACAIQHSRTRHLVSVLCEEPQSRPRVHVEFSSDLKCLPLQCRHCEEPYCVDACISGAVSKDPKTGLINIDEDKCVGCWMCVMVCPFGVVKPSRDKKVALRCDLCKEEKSPACVDACPTKALFYGEIKDFNKLINRKTRKK